MNERGERRTMVANTAIVTWITRDGEQYIAADPRVTELLENIDGKLHDLTEQLAEMRRQR